MKAGSAFLAGGVALVFSFALVGRVAAQSPTPVPRDFTFSSATMQATVDTIQSGPTSPVEPLSCVGYPSPFDSYQWNVALSKIRGDFTQDLENNSILVVFGNGSCTAVNGFDLSNLLAIPPSAVSVSTDNNGVVSAAFEGAIPDFTNEVAVFMKFYLTYNPTKQTTEGLAGGTGTLKVTGNANLCDTLIDDSPSPVCFVLDLSSGDTDTQADIDFACICISTPTVNLLDLSNLVVP